MSTQITKDMAQKICKKLRAEFSKKQGAHVRAKVFHQGKMIATFGIRRGSSKQQGHDHIPKSLYCSPHFCVELATCTKSQQEWIDHLFASGIID